MKVAMLSLSASPLGAFGVIDADGLTIHVAELSGALAKRGHEPGRDELVTASGDVGNVSQLVPTDYIGFPVSAEKLPGHSHALREASVSDYAHESAFVVIEALAATALRIARDKAFRDSLRG